MIPNGINRIISAIAPSPEMRDAMLGDLDEEYQMRVQRDGIAAASRWCWRETMRSLLGALRYSVPNVSAVFTSVLPAMLWGSVIAFLASVAVAAVLSPLALIDSFDKFGVLTGISIVTRFATSIMGGYEAARIGTKAPLWSAIASGLFPAAALAVVSAVTIVPAIVGPAVIVSAIGNVVLVPGALLGGIFQQAQQRTLESAQS